jgi:hypothetical protein
MTTLSIDSCRLTASHTLYAVHQVVFGQGEGFRIMNCQTEPMVTMPFGAFDSRPDPITHAWNRLEARRGLALIYEVKRG